MVGGTPPPGICLRARAEGGAQANSGGRVSRNLREGIPNLQQSSCPDRNSDTTQSQLLYNCEGEP